MIDQFNYMNAMATEEIIFFVCTLAFGTLFYLFLSIGRCFLLINLFFFSHLSPFEKKKKQRDSPTKDTEEITQRHTLFVKCYYDFYVFEL